ncbi:MAG: alpha/beta hydrolase [Planctomycetota bacterium]
MTLHPQSKAFLTLAAESARPQWYEMPLAEARRIFDQFAPLLGEKPELDRIEDHLLEHGVRVRLYSSGDTPRPVIMYFHGGGWVLGNIESHDPLCRRLAVESGCAVVSVDYRLSPESRFPGPVEDCYHATTWVREHADDLGVDANRIAVAGDSAGGQLSAAVCLKARDEDGPPIALQALLYPVVEPNFDTESYRAFADGYGLTRDTMRWFWEQFLGDQEPTPLAAPSLAQSLGGVPPAIVVTAEYDVLRDEGIALAEKMKTDGVDVQHVAYDGMLHGFIHFAGFFETGLEAGKTIAVEIGNRLRG